MKILSIDTASNLCTVAILEDEKCIKELIINDAKNHSEKIMPAIEQVLHETGLVLKNILAKKGWFSPPFQTEKELRDILQKLYKETDIHVDGSMVYFRCVK